jgi:hypothetical protein
MAALAGLLGSAGLMACGSGGPSPDSGSSGAVIAESTSDAALVLEHPDGPRVALPMGALHEGTQIQLRTVEVSPPPDGFEPIGGGVEITVDDPVARTFEPVEITMRFDASEVGADWEVVVGYEHPDHGWTFTDPNHVDRSAGTITFTTFHFSRFAPASVQRAQRVESYLEQRAVDDYVRGELVGAADAQIEEAVRAILADSVGVNDSQVLEIITRAVVSELPMGSMALAVYDLDPDEFAAQMASETASVLAEMLVDADSEFADYLMSSDTAGTLGETSGAASAGDARQVAEIVSMQIISNIPVISQLAKIGATARDVGVHVMNDLWRDGEIEAAYRAYRDGAEGGWFGYSVDAGDWGGLEAQMRGISAKIRSDAVELYASQRGIDPNTLSVAERAVIGDQAMVDLRQRFDDRIAREPEITRLREVNAELYGALIDAGMTDIGEHNPLWREGGNDDPEFFLGRLSAMVEQIQRDTGRTRVMTNAEFESRPTDETSISTLAVVQAIRAWYTSSEADRAAEYRRVLAAHGLIDSVADADEAAPVDQASEDDVPEDELVPGVDPARQAELAEWVSQVCPLYHEAARILAEAEEGWLFDDVVGQGDDTRQRYADIGNRIYELNEQYDWWDYSLCGEAT